MTEGFLPPLPLCRTVAHLLPRSEGASGPENAGPRSGPNDNVAIECAGAIARLDLQAVAWLNGIPGQGAFQEPSGEQQFVASRGVKVHQPPWFEVPAGYILICDFICAFFCGSGFCRCNTHVSHSTGKCPSNHSPPFFIISQLRTFDSPQI